MQGVIVVLKRSRGCEVVCILRFVNPSADFDHWSNGQQLMIFEHLDSKRQHLKHHKWHDHKRVTHGIRTHACTCHRIGQLVRGSSELQGHLWSDCLFWLLASALLSNSTWSVTIEQPSGSGFSSFPSESSTWLGFRETVSQSKATFPKLTRSQ